MKPSRCKIVAVLPRFTAALNPDHCQCVRELCSLLIEPSAPVGYTQSRVFWQGLYREQQFPDASSLLFLPAVMVLRSFHLLTSRCYRRCDSRLQYTCSGTVEIFCPFPSALFKAKLLDVTNFLWRQYLGPETVGRCCDRNAFI